MTGMARPIQSSNFNVEGVFCECLMLPKELPEKDVGVMCRVCVIGDIILLCLRIAETMPDGESRYSMFAAWLQAPAFLLMFSPPAAKGDAQLSDFNFAP